MNERVALFWGTLSYLGIVLVGPLLLLFSLEYTQVSQRIIQNIRPYLFIIPAVTILLVIFNNQFRLIWQDVLVVSSITAVPIRLIYVHGPAFYVNWAYQLILSGVAVLNLFQYGNKQSEERRLQLVWTNVAILIPLLANVVYIVFFAPIVTIDITPFAFLLSGLAIFYGMFRYKFFETRPEAKELAFRNLRTGVLTCDNEGNIIDTNEESFRLLGKNVLTIKELSIDITAPVGVFYWEPMRIWLEYRISRLDTVVAQGGLLVTLHDITTTKQIELDIQQEGVLFSAVLETLPDGLFAIDNEGIVTEWNKKMEEITGITALETVGKPILAFTKRVYGVVKPTLANAVIDERVYWEDFKNIKKVADTLTKYIPLGKRLYLATAAKILDENGNCIGAIETLRDITEQKKHEENLSKHMNELLALNNVLLQHEEELSKLAKMRKT